MKTATKIVLLMVVAMVVAEAAQLDQFWLDDATETPLSRCQRHRNRVTRPGAFKPNCNPDGTYAKVQCNPSSGYCWCAKKDGKGIRGTSVPPGETPNCEIIDDDVADQ